MTTGNTTGGTGVINSTQTDGDVLRCHLEQALETTDNPDARYHLREALQLLDID